MELESSSVPPGFRFHPTEEELVGYYLQRKINSQKIDLDVITEVDLYRIEPWDIQDRCNLGYEEQNEWYFFSHKDKKYPTGTRTNRATVAGFWKATGRDKAVLSKQRIIGMRKTLVFYKGRAPNGKKTDWIMHEYRLQTSENGPPQEEGWVVCRAFKKPTPSHRQGYEAWNHAYYVKNNHNPFEVRTFSNHMSSSSTPLMQLAADSNSYHHQAGGSSYFHQQQSFGNCDDQLQFMDLPQLESPSMCTSTNLATNSTKEGLFDQSTNLNAGTITNENLEDDEKNYYGGQLVDWKTVDRLLASQLTDADLPVIPQDITTIQGSCFLDCFHDL